MIRQFLRRLLGHRQPVLTTGEVRFARGTRSIADLVAPGAIDLHRDHLRLDQQYARTLVVTGYPRSVSPGWLSPLVHLDEPVEISLHVQPLDCAQMVRMLTHKMVQLHSSRLLAARDGRLADPERETAYTDAERLRDAVQLGREKVFSVSLYILVRATSQASLDERTRRIETLLAGLLASSRIAYYEQDTGFRACLPQGTDFLLTGRNLETSSLATMVPFPAASLTSERGILYGIARFNQAPIIIDPFDAGLDNANMVIFAKSGAGKSFFTKIMALRNLYRGIDFLIIDPEDEYRTLCEAVGERGQYIRMAASSGQHLNPLDLPPAGGVDADERDPLDEQVAAVTGLLNLMLAEHAEQPLRSTERGVLEQALYQTYAAASITRDPATHTRPAPLLSDLQRRLSSMPERSAASLAVRLARYTTGPQAGLFAGPTNVALERQLVVFNIQALEPELRPIAIHLITGFIWNQVRQARKPRLLIIDEAWSLIQHAEGGTFLSGMARRARKYYLGLVTITQDVADFLGSAHGRAVLANAALKLVMKQDASAVELLEQTFGLAPEERHLLVSADRGEGLFFAGGCRVPIRVEASADEHQIATTAPRDLAERAGSTPATIRQPARLELPEEVV